MKFVLFKIQIYFVKKHKFLILKIYLEFSKNFLIKYMVESASDHVSAQLSWLYFIRYLELYMVLTLKSKHSS